MSLSVASGIPTYPSMKLAKRFLEIATDECAVAHAAIANRYCAYRERHAARQAVAPTVLHSAVCGPVTLSTLSFGRDMEIEPEDLGTCLLVTTTIKGCTGLLTDHIRCGGGPGSTVLSVASDRPRFHYDSRGEVLKVQFDHRRVSAACWRMLRRQGREPLRFERTMRDPDALRRWLALLGFVVTTLNESDAALREHLTPSLGEMLTLTLLDVQPHNYTETLRTAREGSIAPRQWHRAVEFMEAQIGQALTLAEIAQAAGCSIRSLSRTFREFRQTTPMQHLNHLRLDKIHAALQTTMAPTATIATIAMRYGFNHLGVFNQQYRERYGETPSQTRKRACDGVL